MQLHTIHYYIHPRPVLLPNVQTEDDVTRLSSTIITGNALYVLRSIPDGFVHSVITSPPYWSLRNYGVAGQIGLEENVNDYVAALVNIFEEVRRVLSDRGTLWLIIGDSYTSGGRTWRAPDKKNPVRAMDTRPPTPEGLKPKELVGIPWKIAFALQQAGWYLRSDIIWHKPNCLSGGAIVYVRTQKGDMPMMVKDLVRLRPETVQLWNGEKWTQVVSWQENPRPENPIEITLRNGQRIGCTPEHLWPTQRGNVRADELKISDIIQTCQIPEPCQPETPSMLPDEIGWFVGMYLAEGSRSGSAIQVAGHTKEIERYQRLCKIAEMYGGSCHIYQHSENGVSVNLHGKMLHAIIDTYISGRDASDKHLSVECWRRSNTFLQAILDGYLMGDGHLDVTNNRWRVGFTRNYNLENDLRTLCARLGFSLRLKPGISTNTSTGKIHSSFKGEIRLIRGNHHNNKDGGEVIQIGKSRARHFWDIAVADDPHLFALASGVLTHNCMPESVKDRPTRSHEYVFLFTRAEQYAYDNTAVQETGKSNLRSVWDINTRPFPDAHFATFPPELVERCLLLGSRPGDIVCDPFMGSGTTGVVATQCGRAFLGIEFNPEYVEVTRRRFGKIDNELEFRIEHVG